jgi:hypothetical protein
LAKVNSIGEKKVIIKLLLLPLRNLEQMLHDIFRVHLDAIVEELVRDILLDISDLGGSILCKVEVDVPISQSVSVTREQSLRDAEDIHVFIISDGWCNILVMTDGIRKFTYVAALIATSFFASWSRLYNGPQELSLAKISATPLSGRRLI